MGDLQRISVLMATVVLILLWTQHEALTGNITNETITLDQQGLPGYVRLYESSVGGVNYTQFSTPASLTSDHDCRAFEDGRWPLKCLDTGDANKGVMLWGSGAGGFTTGNLVCGATEFTINCARTVSMTGTDTDCTSSYSDYFYALCY